MFDDMSPDEVIVFITAWLASLPKPPEFIRVLLLARDGLSKMERIPYRCFQQRMYRKPLKCNEVAFIPEGALPSPYDTLQIREYMFWGKMVKHDFGAPVPIMEER